jgi:hypothetical protein
LFVVVKLEWLFILISYHRVSTLFIVGGSDTPNSGHQI